MIRWIVRTWLIWAGTRLARDYAWTDGNPDGQRHRRHRRARLSVRWLTRWLSVRLPRSAMLLPGWVVSPTVLSGRAGTQVVVWAGPDLLVEVELVFRERVVFVLVGRTVNGRRPGGYYVCDGVRVRWHLVEVFDDVPALAALAAALRAVTRRRDADAMLAQIDVLSAALVDHFDEVAGFIRCRVAASG